MKRLLSVPLIFLIFFSGIGLRYSAHLCGGNVVSTKFSLKDDVATCGMENSNPEKPGNFRIESRCCDNLIADLLLKTNYLPSSVTKLQILSFTDSFSFSSYCLPESQPSFLNPPLSKSAPPGGKYSNIISPSEFRILRI